MHALRRKRTSATLDQHGAGVHEELLIQIQHEATADEMNIAFILSMPGRNSWNGKWSGDDRLFAVVKPIGRSDKALNRARAIEGAAPYSYNFGDGWRASIHVKIVDGQEARSLRKRSQGFCGYEWMIQSIMSDGAIYGPTQPKPEAVPA